MRRMHHCQTHPLRTSEVWGPASFASSQATPQHGAIGTVCQVQDETPGPQQIAVQVSWDNTPEDKDFEQLVLNPGNHIVAHNYAHFVPGDVVAIKNTSGVGYRDVQVATRIRHSRYTVVERGQQNTQHSFELDFNQDNVYKPCLNPTVGAWQLRQLLSAMAHGTSSRLHCGARVFKHLHFGVCVCACQTTKSRR